MALKISITSSSVISSQSWSWTLVSISEESKSRNAENDWSIEFFGCLWSVYFTRTDIVSLVFDAYASSVTACGVSE